jgi:cobaltochelatase CobS
MNDAQIQSFVLANPSITCRQLAAQAGIGRTRAAQIIKAVKEGTDMPQPKKPAFSFGRLSTVHTGHNDNDNTPAPEAPAPKPQPKTEAPAPAPAPAPKPQPKTEAPAPTTDKAHQAIALLSEVLGAQQHSAPLDEARIVELIKEHSGAVHQVVIQPAHASAVTMGAGELYHREAALVHTIMQCGVPLWLVGPAGTGKSHLARQAAHMCGIQDDRIWCVSVCAQTSKAELTGYMDAHGQYVPRALYHWAQQGGVFVLDEADNGNANVLSVLNATLSNGHLLFPNGENVTLHADCRLVACANTYGNGATRQYVGRLQIDAATLDRFAMVFIGIDHDVERALAGLDYPDQSKKLVDATAAIQPPAPAEAQKIVTEYMEDVHKWRTAAADLQERIIISPRASKHGAALIRAGVHPYTVADVCVFKGHSAAQTIISRAKEL